MCGMIINMHQADIILQPSCEFSKITVQKVLFLISE